MIDPDNVLGDNIGSIEVIQQVGTEKMIVNAARASNKGTDKQRGYLGSEVDETDLKLMKFLAKSNPKHTSPFEHNLITFAVKAPLFVARQWFRHRIGVSFNEISGRYVELKDVEFYIPKEFRLQSETNRQASQGVLEDPSLNKIVQQEVKNINIFALEQYNRMRLLGIAKEQCRSVLPQSMYTQFYFTCNLVSLSHFLKLRDHEDAQWEIQQYAKCIQQEAEKYWPNALPLLLGEK